MVRDFVHGGCATMFRLVFAGISTWASLAELAVAITLACPLLSMLEACDRALPGSSLVDLERPVSSGRRPDGRGRCQHDEASCRNG